MSIKEKITAGSTFLGIEFGSTRIKAVLIDDSFGVIASGSCDWENRCENGVWTYSQTDIINGMQTCYKSLADDVKKQYGIIPESYAAIGFSGMMHGYMAFDESGKLLTPFRTWRNTMTAKAADELTELFGFNIPQRWSCAHLYQAVLNKEEHIGKLCRINTLAGHIHYLLSDAFEVGIGEASGIFPVENGGYNKEYMDKFSAKLHEMGFKKNIYDVFPKVRSAGECDAFLTEEGARLLDPTGTLKSGIPMCAPEGDAGTGMTATNSVRARTGNISAGTSVFAMLVLDKPLSGYYKEIDMVTTPSGDPAAMVHCNNCCGELDAWVNVFSEFAALTGLPKDKSSLYETLYKNALEAPADCGGVVCYNYISGEPVTNVESGRPMYMRMPDSRLTLASLFRSELYSAVASLCIGMEILFENEKVFADKFTAHGGLFKVKGVAQQLLSDALCTPVAVMETAGEGGAWGMALLAAYSVIGKDLSLSDFLDEKVFKNTEGALLKPKADGTAGFRKYIDNYKAGLAAQRAFSDITKGCESNA